MIHTKFAALLCLSLTVMPAMADETVNPSSEKLYNFSDTSRVYDLDEVVVVSQPKDLFRLRRQALSSNVYSYKELNALGVRDLQELSAYVPSFTMPSYGSRLTSSIYVRGIGSRVNSPAMGITLDGVPLMSKSAFNFHNYGISRIDVLRGPQGTLYGQNTEGGLVRIYTLNPMTYQGTDIALGAGSRFYRNAEITHYAKLSDRAAFSLGGFYNGQNGFFHNTFDGGRADDYNEAGGRFRLVMTPTDRMTLNYWADYQYVRQNGFPYGILDTNTGRAAEPSVNRQGNYRRNMLTTAFTLDFKANAFDFTSTTSYQYLKDYMLMDIDYLPQDLMYMEERQHQNAITQEFDFKGFVPYQAQGSTGWHWVAGAFGSYQWNKTQAPVYFEKDMDDMLSSSISNAMYNAIYASMVSRFTGMGMGEQQAATMAQQTIERAGGVSMQADLQTVPGLFHTPQFNIAFYHESSFDITPKLMATIGLRYDYNRVKIHYQTSAAMTATANVMGRTSTINITSLLDNKAHNNFNQLLPKFSLRYSLGRHGNVYATVSKGYRAGGFNYQMFSDILRADLENNANQRADYNVPHDADTYRNINNTISYKPEISWNYEVGAHLNLLGDALHLDIAAYYMQVRNQQLSVMAGNYGFGRMMVNAGKSYSCGVELSLSGNALNQHLSYNLGYSFTHAVFEDYEDSIRVNGNLQPVSYKDNHVPYMPQHILSANADYRFFLNGALKSITIGTNVRAQGKIYWDVANTTSQKFYAVLGAHADADFGFLTLSLWGRNLTQTRYNTFAVESAATGTSHYFAQRGNPFSMGIDIRMHF